MYDLTFVAASGSGGVEAVYADESIWLTQKMMGVLYDVETHTINYHLKKVFSDSELQEDAVIRKFRITATDGKNYNTLHYKLHWSIHGQTAAEVIVNRADAEKQHMGLTTWKDAPRGKIQKFDVSVAKNYLTEDEMAQLSRLVNAYPNAYIEVSGALASDTLRSVRRFQAVKASIPAGSLLSIISCRSIFRLALSISIPAMFPSAS